MTIPRAVIDQVIAEARLAAPRECCGLLVGSGTAILAAVPARNLATSDTRYLIDPVDHIRVRRESRARGFDLVGFYHSHPHGQPWPSATDVNEAEYPDAVWMIVGLEPEAVVRLFRIRDGEVREEGLAPLAPT